MPAYKYKPTGTWFAMFSIKNWEGTKRCITKRGFRTKKEAIEWENRYRVQKTGAPDMFFEDYASLYFEDIAPNIKESTFDTKTNIIQHHIVPYFAKKRLCDITPKDVMKWQNSMRLLTNPVTGMKFTQSYLKTLRNQLNAMLNHAVKYYDLPKNVAHSTEKMGSSKPINTNFWTLEEYKRFIPMIISRPEEYFAFEILYWTGIREGELLALTPEDFDFENHRLFISKTYHRAKGKDIVTDPKTAKSNRTVILTNNLREELEGYFSIIHPTKGQRVFTISKQALAHTMEYGCKRASVKRIRIHDLRHSHVSLLIHLGYTALAIADRMGHETADITFRYAHLFPSVQGEIAEKLNSIQEII